MFLSARRSPSSATINTFASSAGRLLSTSLPSSSSSLPLTIRNASACRYITLASSFSNRTLSLLYHPRSLSTIQSSQQYSLHTQSRKRQQALPFSSEEPGYGAQEGTSSSKIESDDADDLKPTGEGPVTKFQDLVDRGLVDEVVADALIKHMGLKTMTQVQSQTLQQALQGRDVLAQAKTGTGKTIGFLLPTLQRILNADRTLAKPSASSKRTYGVKADIRAIIVSPTRELAEQIAEEARKLVRGTSVVVQTAVGGTQKQIHLRRMHQQGCHILVGTPGRLNDILSDPSSYVKAPNLDSFVLDEADRLMDDGFWPAIQDIQSYLPSKNVKDRQTLMYSATLPQNVIKLVRATMKPDLHYFAAVQGEEKPTHERVKQHLVQAPGYANLLPSLLELCQREILAAEASPDQPPFKAIVYFNGIAEVRYAWLLLRRMTSISNEWKDLFRKSPLHSIHSQLSQAQRTASADRFRRGRSGILLSSDVTARGMDFPNVTHVIQVGLPGDRDTYIHRLGRTARAGREGEGWLIISDLMAEEARMRLENLTPAKDTSLNCAKVNFGTSEVGTDTDIPGMTSKASEIFSAVSEAAKSCISEHQTLYRLYLATSQWCKSKQGVVDSVNQLARVQWGMHALPAMKRDFLAKVGLSRVEGLNVVGGSDSPSRRGGVRDRDSDSERYQGRSSGDRRNFGRPSSFSLRRQSFDRESYSNHRRDDNNYSFSSGRGGSRSSDNEDRAFERPASFNGF